MGVYIKKNLFVPRLAEDLTIKDALIYEDKDFKYVKNAIKQKKSKNFTDEERKFILRDKKIKNFE